MGNRAALRPKTGSVRSVSVISGDITVTGTRTPSATVRRLESIPSAAEYLDVSTKTVRRYIAAGRITGYRTGPKLIRVDLNELDTMLQPIPTAGTPS